MKRYRVSSRIARFFLCANFCVFSYSPAMQLPPDVQQQIINAPQLRSAVQEVQRDSARAAWRGKALDIKQAFVRSEKFQAALSTAIDAEYKNLLSATEQIAQSGSQKDAKTAAKQALKKIPKDKPSSFSRYAKIAAIAALAAVVVAYGGVSLSEQGSSVGPWNQKGAPVLVAGPQGAPATSSAQSVVLPEVKAFTQQGGGEGGAFSPYVFIPTYEADPVRNLFGVVGENYANYVRKETADTFESAILRNLVSGLDSPNFGHQTLLLIDKIGESTDVLISAFKDDPSTPDRHGWLYHEKTDSKIYFAKWSYTRRSPIFGKEKESLHITQEIEVDGDAEKAYEKLLVALRAKKESDLKDIGVTENVLINVFGFTPADISRNFHKVVSESGALFTHKETSKNLKDALADLIKIQEQAKDQLLLVDVVGDLSGDGFSGVLFATVDSNEATPNDKHGWVYYFKPGSGLHFAEWSYKFDLNALFNKETFHIAQEQALAVTGQEEHNYVLLLENLRKKLPPYKINQNISPKFVENAFKNVGEQPIGVDPIKWLNYFAGPRDILLESYERAFAKFSFDQALSSMLDPQLVDKNMIALCDVLNGDYKRAIIAIEAGHNWRPLDRWGWMYYKNLGKTYFALWTSKVAPQRPKEAVIFKFESEEEVTDLEEISHYENLYEVLKSHRGKLFNRGKSFKFSELPFEKIYGTK